MRILVDEDLASRELVERLRTHLGDDILEPKLESSDEEVWNRAQAESAAVLTANVVDFLRLAGGNPDHHGLLLVYRTKDRETDLRAKDIERAILAICEQFAGGIDGRIIPVNDFARQ